MITIALSKGRIFEETLPLLRAAGIEVLDDPEKSRKLILDTNHADVRVLVVRATDVPTYVQFGGADMGITGKDTLLEHGGDWGSATSGARPPAWLSLPPAAAEPCPGSQRRPGARAGGAAAAGSSSGPCLLTRAAGL
jgi:hypothetical protein